MGFKITAFDVNHGKLIKPAIGYRIDYDGRSVVISGDTKYNENLIKHSMGVDLLLHQVAAARQELLDSAPLWKAIMAHHTKPDEVGKVFTQTKPKLAALYHLVVLTNGKIPPVKPPEMLAIVKEHYDGDVVLSKDLMTFMIGKDKVVVSE